MIRQLSTLLILASAVLAGCATKPQNPVAMNAAAALKPEVRIGVAMTALPKADTFFPGAGCLLCYAAASVANNSLTGVAHSLPSDELALVKVQMMEAVTKKGGQAVLIDEAVDLKTFPELANWEQNRPRRDFSRLRDKYKIDKLLLIQIDSLGFQRNYSAYIPTSDPRAWVHGAGSLVDLGSQRLEWWQPIDVVKASSGKWDEPPKYPGLTNAYFQAIELTKDRLLNPLQ